MTVQLSAFVAAFARGIKVADTAMPVAISKRSGLSYQPGIGPHTESDTITLALEAVLDPMPPTRREVPYPSVARSRCDVVIDERPGWAIEFKMLRLMGDNGKPNDNMLMHILSPYPVHRSAVTDCPKLLVSGFDHRKAIIVFGYDYDTLVMDPAIDAFEALAGRHARLIAAASSAFDDLVHPVHRRGRVFGWQVTANE